MNESRPTVYFVLAKLQMGGIENNTLMLIKQCIQWGVRVELIIVERKGDLLDALPPQLALSCLGVPIKSAFPFRLARFLRNKRQAFIISAFDDVNVLVVAAMVLGRSDASLLLSNHNTFSIAKEDSSGLNKAKYWVLQNVLPWVFRRAKSVVAVSGGVADDLSRTLSVPRNMIHVVYNPVVDSEFHNRARLPVTHAVSDRTVLFVGRLVSQKDVPNLLAACAILKKRRPIDVVIVGDGPERGMVEARVNEMGLTEEVRLTGTVQNPLPLMAGSGLLVLPSRFEGLGNVLIEAMACGTQVVATDCPHGPAEILDGGRYGQLVPVSDPAALAAAIERSLDGEFWVDPNVLRARAAEFSVEKATRRYLELAGYDISTLPPPKPAAPQTHRAAD